MKKRVAIIGAGVSGLPAIKCCLDEELEPVCFERSGDIGGLWNYEQGLKNQKFISVMNSTFTNTSKVFSCYSDFPFPKQFPVYLHHRKMLEYLRLYAENFNLENHIQLNTEVLKVKKEQDFFSSGRWTVTWKNLKTKEEKSEVFDAVMLCTGKYTQPRMVQFEGQEKFKGQILHSRDYKTNQGYEGKKVIVVGMKCTGIDIAVELSDIGCEVYVSSRKGAWIVRRLIDGNIVSDVANLRRSKGWLGQILPDIWLGKMTKKAFNQSFNQAEYGIEPKHYPGLWSGIFAVSDTFPDMIVMERISVKPNISRFTETSVEFEDGSVVDDVDLVIFCTGYITSMPFLEDGLFTMDDDNNVELYRTMFSPYIRPATIALIGIEFAASGVMSFSEMQCRVATRMFKGDINLPDEAEMVREIRVRRERIKDLSLKLNFSGVPDYYVHDYISTTTQLASMCGCAPSFFKLLRMDRRLAWQYLFGPAVPVQFRLCGHGAWAGAKDTVLSTNHRAAFPYPQVFKSNDAPADRRKSDFNKIILMFVTAVVFYAFNI